MEQAVIAVGRRRNVARLQLGNGVIDRTTDGQIWDNLGAIVPRHRSLSGTLPWVGSPL
jgi:hypothetical protein